MVEPVWKQSCFSRSATAQTSIGIKSRIVPGRLTALIPAWEKVTSQPWAGGAFHTGTLQDPGVHFRSTANFPFRSAWDMAMGPPVTRLRKLVSRLKGGVVSSSVCYENNGMMGILAGNPSLVWNVCVRFSCVENMWKSRPCMADTHLWIMAAMLN